MISFRRKKCLPGTARPPSVPSPSFGRSVEKFYSNFPTNLQILTNIFRFSGEERFSRSSSTSWIQSLELRGFRRAPISGFHPRELSWPRAKFDSQGRGPSFGSGFGKQRSCPPVYEASSWVQRTSVAIGGVTPKAWVPEAPRQCWAGRNGRRRRRGGVATPLPLC